MNSDETLMQAFRSGSREAFEELSSDTGGRCMASSGGVWKAGNAPRI